jgi:TldD protein
MPRLGALLLLAGAAFAQTPPLVRILAGELDRNFELLKKKGDPAPYFISYQVTEIESGVASASAGALKTLRKDRARLLDVSVRTGSPQLDNYHQIGRDYPRFASGAAIPLEDNAAAISRALWLETDRVYRLASERLIKVRAAEQVRAASADDSPDFSPAEPVTRFVPPPPFVFDEARAAARVRKLSAALANSPGVIESSVTLSVQRQTKSFVSTEGTRLQHGRGFARLTAFARGKDADGSDIVLTRSFDAEDMAGLPDDATVASELSAMAKDVEALLRAPAADPYAGPAILSGSAAAVLFHEIFGHRIEGHRQKDTSDGQTFTRRVGSAVLPEFISVTFDPTMRRLGGVSLNGWYEYDDEGVKARPVKVVENGVLKSFLMSRSPVRGFPESNGHGRSSPGREPVARQSNLIVESSKKVTGAELRRMLLDEVKRQGKPYGLLFRDVTGGFTTTAREGLQAFKVMPLVVDRVWADGRPDELIRGADMVGTPLASFAKIMATSDRLEVFNGYCGAESGSIPVAAAAPALLVSEIEIQKKPHSTERPPLLGPPSIRAAEEGAL